MPVPPKPPEKRQRRNKRTEVGELVPIAAGKAIPEPPSSLRPLTTAAWESFWCSPLAQIITDSDLPALHRLFGLHDELEEIWKFAREHRLTTGSQGQDVLNPLYSQANILRAEIRQLEDRFGMTPIARMRLGVKFGEAKRSLADELNGEPDADSHQAEIDAIDGATG